MSGREKGVAAGSCASCGAELQLISQPDGGITSEPCPSCYGEVPAPELAHSERRSLFSRRETGTGVEVDDD